MPRHKLPPGPGRPKGSKNVVPAALKDLILGALEQVGGQDYLAEQARKNPVAFLSLVGRVLPVQVKEGGTDPTMPVDTTIELNDNTSARP